MLAKHHPRALLLVGLTMTVALLPAPLHSDPPAAEAKADPLVALNKAFRLAYAQARQEVVARTQPVILVSGDDLILLRRGKRTEVKVTPDSYHTLKAIAHVPLALHVLLLHVTDKELDDKKLVELRGYREKLQAVAPTLAERGFSPETLARQQKILAGSQRLLDGVLAAKRLSTADLLAFTREQGPLVLASAAEAARSQLDGLHKQVSAWQAELTPDEWRQLRVVIMGSALPRVGNLAKQYFSRLLGEPGEGLRIIYAEAIFDEARALSLLGTNLLDREVGVAFFDDEKRMHRDLLADAATAYLKEMKFKP